MTAEKKKELQAMQRVNDLVKAWVLVFLFSRRFVRFL